MSRPVPHPLKAELVRRGIRQREFAQAVGLNAHALGRVLNGHQASWPALRRRCAEVLDLDEAQLFRRPDDEVEEAVAVILAQRSEQGLPATVEDPAVLRRLAAVLSTAAARAECRAAAS